MKAAIDIGSNTVRMLVGEFSCGRIIPHDYFRYVTRLGGGYDPVVGISKASAERTLSALTDFAEALKLIAPSQIRVVATEAVRRAVNARQFLDEVYTCTGFSVEIIDGVEEAALSSAGVLAALQPPPAAALIFDVGGGSTEFIVVKGGRRLWQKSYPLGVVTLAEASAPSQTIESFLGLLADDLSTAGLSSLVVSKECELVGTAGTVTSLAALDLAMVQYDWRRINNHVLPQINLLSLYERLRPLSAVERESLPGLETGRGDLIVHGAAIVLSLLDLFHKERLRVSDFGLLEGTLISME